MSFGVCVYMLQASAEIMRLLAQSAPGCAFEKASIDEAYLDITQLAVRASWRASTGLLSTGVKP